MGRLGDSSGLHRMHSIVPLCFFHSLGSIQPQNSRCNHYLLDHHQQYIVFHSLHYLSSHSAHESSRNCNLVDCHPTTQIFLQWFYRLDLSSKRHSLQLHCLKAFVLYSYEMKEDDHHSSIHTCFQHLASFN